MNGARVENTAMFWSYFLQLVAPMEDARSTDGFDLPVVSLLCFPLEIYMYMYMHMCTCAPLGIPTNSIFYII